MVESFQRDVDLPGWAGSCFGRKIGWQGEFKKSTSFEPAIVTTGCFDRVIVCSLFVNNQEKLRFNLFAKKTSCQNRF